LRRKGKNSKHSGQKLFQRGGAPDETLPRRKKQKNHHRGVKTYCLRGGINRGKV